MAEQTENAPELKPLATLEAGKTYLLKRDWICSQEQQEWLDEYLKTEGAKVGCKFVVLPPIISPVYGLEVVEL